MANHYETGRARSLGKGFQAPGGSVTDAQLADRFKGYKRSIASRYRSLNNEEIEQFAPHGTLLASPKIDGEMWFMVWEDGDVWLSNPRGRVVYGDVPVLLEAKKLAARVPGLTIFAGELFAVRKGARPRHDDLAAAMGGEAKAEVARMGFQAFDLLETGDDSSIAHYSERLATMQKLLEGGKRIKCVKTVEIEGAPAIRAMYEELVESGKAEGLVLRTADGRTYKLKPVFTLDAVVIGFTERTEEPGVLRSMALALIRDDGQYQICGSCGNMPMDTRRVMFSKLSQSPVESSFRHASSSGAVYRFIKPEVVVEIKVTDILADEADGSPIQRMVCTYDETKGWTAVRRMPGVSILHPVFVRLRDDKDADDVGVRMAQVLDRVVVPELGVHAEAIDLPKSEVLRREVYTKVTKGKTAVRKLLVWQTHKETLDPNFPAYVVAFTDYSPGRKDPIKREVRLAPNLEAAEGIAEDMITRGVKRGWKRVEA